MPAGFMIESGQADLMLISWMGIDLLNLGTRAYPLARVHASPTTAICRRRVRRSSSEIRITGHARHGDIRIFFFEYDCTVDGVPRLTVRRRAGGVLRPAGARRRPGCAVDAGARTGRSERHRPCRPAGGGVHQAIVQRGRGHGVQRGGECSSASGPASSGPRPTPARRRSRRARSCSSTRSPSSTRRGGPWGRGFMRCEAAIRRRRMVLRGSFQETIRACPATSWSRRAWRRCRSTSLHSGTPCDTTGGASNPCPSLPFELKCRGEINPRTERVAYELYVEEVWAGPHPTVICDVIGFVDGKAAFHAHRIGGRARPRLAAHDDAGAVRGRGRAGRRRHRSQRLPVRSQGDDLVRVGQAVGGGSASCTRCSTGRDVRHGCRVSRTTS